MDKKIRNIAVIIAVLAVISTISGLIDCGKGEPWNFVNIHGDTVEIYGKGLYKNNSVFFTPIFKGTDLAILVLGIPLLIFSIYYDFKKHNLPSALLLTAVIAVFLYYSASLAFGVMYNTLFIIYLLLFSFSLFGLVLAIQSNQKRFADIQIMFNTSKSLNIFLILGDISLFVAWLPDIIQSFFIGKLLTTDVYHTQITYILDMGIISPMIFFCFYHLRKHNFIGIQLLAITLICCVIIAIMLPVQTLFQFRHGIDVPLEALILKVAIFVLLGGFAFYFTVKSYLTLKTYEKNILSNTQ